jgi:hypothetical protein
VELTGNVRTGSKFGGFMKDSVLRERAKAEQWAARLSLSVRHALMSVRTARSAS